MLTVSTLMGVSATMFSMVGGFLLLRHTRITTQIAEAKHREDIYRVEEKAIRSQEGWYTRHETEERHRVLRSKTATEKKLAARLTASRGRLRAIALSWLVMFAVGLVAPIVVTGFVGWTAPDYALGIAHLVVMLAMVLAVWFALVPRKADPILAGEEDSVLRDFGASDQANNRR